MTHRGALGLVAVLLMAGCGGGGSSTLTAPTPVATQPPAPAPSPTPTPSPTPPASETPPALSVSIVDLSGSYDPATKRLGALLCTFTFGADPNDRWCFNAFASTAVPNKQGVSYDYKTVAGAAVFAATAGTVFRIDADTSANYPNEFEIETRSAVDGSYLVIYDHVKNLAVGVGTMVQPGAVLGTVGIHTTNPSVWGRAELQINKVTQRSPRIQSIAVCPRALGTDRFNQLNDAALAAHNNANAPFASASVCVADQLGPF